MGGRGSGSNMRSSSTTASTRRGRVITGGSVTGNFTEVSNGRFVSDRQAVTAAAGSASATDPQFEIIRGEYKGRTVYRSYQNMLNHREFLHRSSSVEEAVRKLNR